MDKYSNLKEGIKGSDSGQNTEAEELSKKKTEMTSLDIMFAVKELKERLTGGVFRKIYQYGNSKAKQLLFEIYANKEKHLLYVNDNKIFLSRKKEIVPIEPPSFCMFLRKHLMGKKIQDIYQHGFDRIVELKTDENILVFEMIRPGNVILCDKLYHIIMPLEIQRWKFRKIVPKISYKYPPEQINPFSLGFDNIRDMTRASDKKLVVFLAKELGFGGVYAEELCKRAGVDGQKPVTGLTMEELINVHRYIQALERIETKPFVYRDMVSPFPLKIKEGEWGEEKASFSDALDEYFSEVKLQIRKEEKIREAEEKIKRAERIMEVHGEAKEKWERIERENRECAEAINNFYSTVEAVLNAIQRAREMGVTWDELKRKITSEESPEAESVKEIREDESIVVLSLGGKEVEIDFRKTVEENAAKYFEDAKWARKKLEAVERSAEAMEREMKEEKQVKPGLLEGEEEPEAGKFQEKKTKPEEQVGISTFLREDVEEKKTEETKEEPVAEERPKWYEKYKWFISSDGFLVIAGKSAGQNEEIVKKHTEANDLIYHADIPGAAFVVVKVDEKEVIPDETRKEAAEFAAANSKAWSRGLGTVDVYAVKPEQVSKTPPSGEYLPKGSFVIKGERIWYRNTELKLSIGVKIDREMEKVKVLAGPVMAIRINADYFVTIKPGFRKATELSRSIKNKILIKAKPEDKFIIEKLPLDEIEKFIPSGQGEIVEYG